MKKYRINTDNLEWYDSAFKKGAIVNMESGGWIMGSDGGLTPQRVRLIKEHYPTWLVEIGGLEFTREDMENFADFVIKKVKYTPLDWINSNDMWNEWLKQRKC